MRASGAAEAAGRMHDRLLTQARTGPPKRIRRRGQPAACHRNPETQPDSVISIGEMAGQRALFKAVARAAELDRLADFLLHLGYAPAAERISHQAHSIPDGGAHMTANTPATVLAYDGAGINLGAGPSFADLDLRDWPACCVVRVDPSNWDGTVELIVIFPGDNLHLPLRRFLALVLAAADRDDAIALHARDEDTLRMWHTAITSWTGGAHV